MVGNNISNANLLRYNMAAADSLKNHFNPAQLDPSKNYQVNMYFSGSPYSKEAYLNGTNGRAGSHIGNLQNINGRWFVVHNFHHAILADPLEDLLGSKGAVGVTQISTPSHRNGGVFIKYF